MPCRGRQEPISFDEVSKKDYATFLTILAPLAPHTSDELWRQLGHKGSIHLQSWPDYDPALLVADTVQLPVQVNGKLRGTITIAPDAPEQEAVFAARQNDNVAKYLGDGEPRKTIYIAGKMLNFVVAGS